MANVKINFKEIVNSISNELSTLIQTISNAEEGTYERGVYESIKGTEFFVENERDFIKRKDIKPNAVYVVVKFGNSSTNFGASVCPVSLVIMSTRNKLEPTQDFFGLFVSSFSLGTFADNALITQIWMTPSVVNAFNDTDNGFRALFSVAGTLVIGASTIKVGSIKYYYDESDSSKFEEIPFMAYHEGYQAANNPQPFGNTAGFARSEVNFATDSFTISTYLLNSRFVKDCLKVRGLRVINSASGATSRIASDKNPNSIFNLKIEFDAENETLTNFPQTGEAEQTGTNPDLVLGKNIFYKYKLISYQLDQKVGDIPSFTVSFTY